MIEKTILDHLAARLPVPVYMEVPEQPPASFVLLEKTGSGHRSLIRSATFAVQSYGASLLAAAELNERAKEAMDALPVLEGVCRTSLNSDYNFTDTATKRHRYQAVYDVTYY